LGSSLHPETIVTHPELEIISPENITKLTQIARWGDGKIYDVAISPDNQTIAISMIDGIHLYDSVTLTEKQFIKREIFNTTDLSLPISFSPDGNYLAISSGMGVSLLNLSTNEYDKSVFSAIPDLNIVDIQVSQDNNHIIFNHRWRIQSL
jgi:WD40 repeat protein